MFKRFVYTHCYAILACVCEELPTSNSVRYRVHVTFPATTMTYYRRTVSENESSLADNRRILSGFCCRGQGPVIEGSTHVWNPLGVRLCWKTPSICLGPYIAAAAVVAQSFVVFISGRPIRHSFSRQRTVHRRSRPVNRTHRDIIINTGARLFWCTYKWSNCIKYTNI